MIRGACFLFSLTLGIAVAQTADYGVDCSFPIHSTDFKCGDLLGNRKAVYEEYMQGCRDFNGKRGNRCDSYEKDRLENNVLQPQSMVNYTSTGFMKIKAPKAVQDLIFNHWEANNHLREKEDWGVGNVYSNNWVSPTYMVGVENPNLRGAGSRLKEKIWDAARSTIEQWTGMELRPASVSLV
jgi:prolyl 4-hydroxylase